MAYQHQLLRCSSKLVLNEGPKLSRLVIKRTAVSELQEQYSVNDHKGDTVPPVGEEGRGSVGC